MNNLPKRYEEINICGATVLAAEGADGKCYVSPRHICQSLGIDWATQFTKIKADPVLGPSVVEITTQLPGTSQTRAYLMLPIEFLSGWLFPIKKVRPEVQAKLNQFRAEAFIALDAWFRQGLRSDLEVQAKFQVPQSLAEALELAAQQIRAREKAEEEAEIAKAEVIELAPKAAKYDEFLDADGLMTMSVAGGLFGKSGVEVGSILRRAGWLHIRTDERVPTVKALRDGLMKSLVYITPSQRVVSNPKLTPKGVDRLADIIKKLEVEG